MTRFPVDGEEFFKCDTCGKQTWMGEPLPSDWHFIAFGRGQHTENADEVKHYCSQNCRDQWVLTRVIRHGDLPNYGDTTFPVSFKASDVIVVNPLNYRIGT